MADKVSSAPSAPSALSGWWDRLVVLGVVLGVVVVLSLVSHGISADAPSEDVRAMVLDFAGRSETASARAGDLADPVARALAARSAAAWGSAAERAATVGALGGSEARRAVRAARVGRSTLEEALAGLRAGDSSG